MSAPAIGLRRNWLPGPTARVDSAHPLAEGMVACILPTWRQDILRSQPLRNSYPASSSRVATPYGLGLTGVLSTEFPGSNAETTHLAFTSGDWTVATFVYWLATPVAGVTVFARVRYASGTDSQGWTLYYGSGSTMRFGSFNNTSTTNDASIAVTPVAGDVMGVVGTSDGANRYIWIDNVKSAASTSVPNPAAVATNGMTYGGRVSTTNYAANLICLAWNRTLSDGEIISWQQNPFEMLRS